MKKISYSAPAKVILSGEHAVVYGKPAIVSAFDLRLKFSLWQENKKITEENILLLVDTVKNYLNKNKIKFLAKKFNYKIKSNIPIRRGLGSSAAFSAAGVASFLEFYTGRKFNKETINNLAYLAEKHFHKNASGVDTSTSVFGGLIYYRREFEFLKNISCLNFKIAKKISERLYLIDSGKPAESTREMVEQVGGSYNQKPQFIEAVLNDIEKTTKRLVIALIKEDEFFFQKAIVDNQALLEILGVVSQKTKSLLKLLELYGMGKVTGAGGKKSGSGFILFIANNKSGLEEYLKRKKLNYYKFQQDFEGLRNEEN